MPSHFQRVSSELARRADNDIVDLSVAQAAHVLRVLGQMTRLVEWRTTIWLALGNESVCRDCGAGVRATTMAQERSPRGE